VYSAKSTGPVRLILRLLDCLTKDGVCLGASSGILGHGCSRGTSFIHLGFVVAEI
jgi:hypothetical protein